MFTNPIKWLRRRLYARRREPVLKRIRDFACSSWCMDVPHPWRIAVTIEEWDLLADDEPLFFIPSTKPFCCERMARYSTPYGIVELWLAD